jgi:hypothetical protein
MENQEATNERDWEQIANVLEDCVAKLRRPEREAVLLRFYEQKSFAEVGDALGITEEAARKRVSRAVEKLRDVLSARNAATAPGSLGGLLSTCAVMHAPASLVRSIVSSATGAAAGTGVAAMAKGALAIMTWSKLKLTTAAVIGAICLSGATVAIVIFSRPAAAIPTTAPAVVADQSPDAWRDRFNRVYHLEDGQVLKHVPQPFIPERMTFWNDAFNANPQRQDNYFGVVFYRVSDTIQIRGISSQETCPLDRVLDFGFRLKSYEWDGPENLLAIQLSGDWVVREGTSPPDLMDALSKILQSELKRPIRFVLKATPQQVLVASGRYEHHFLPTSVDPKQYGQIHVFVGSLDSGIWPVNHYPLPKFMEELGHQLRVRIVNEAQMDEPNPEVQWTVHSTASALKTMPPGDEKDRTIERVAESLHAQTGLTYTMEYRSFPVWHIEEFKP